MSYPVQLDANARIGNGSSSNRSALARRKKLPVWSCGRKSRRRFRCRTRNFLARAQRIARGAGADSWSAWWIGSRCPAEGLERTTAPRCSIPRGALDFIYDKIHLVPFSEYVPWRKWLFFASDLTGLDLAIFSTARNTKLAIFPAGRSALISAMKPFSRMKFAASRWPERRCSSIFQMTAGLAGRARPSSTWRWRACARWKTGGGCCVTPTTESRCPSIPTGALSRACRATFAVNWTRRTVFAPT